MVKKIIVYSLLGIVSIILIALILLPFVAPGYIEKHSKEWIGRSVSLEKMRINYFTGTLRLYDFNLYEKDDSTVFVGFDTLILDTEPYRLFGNTFVVEQFYLQGLFVDVIMYDSAFNFDDLLELGNDSTSVEEEPPSDEEPMRFELSDMELKDAVFIIQDAEIQDSIEMDNFDFFLPHLVWDQDEESEADIKFDFKNGGYFESIADYNPGNGNFLLDFTLGNYQISGYQKFAAKYVDIGKFEGVLDVKLKLVGNIEDPIGTNISSNFKMSDFALYDDKDNVMVGTKLFMVDLDEANMKTKKIFIDSILVSEPSLYYEAYDSTSNIAEFMKRVMPPEDSVQNEDSTTQVATNEVTENDIDQDSVSSDSGQKFDISLNTIILEKGVVDLADYSHERSFEYKISDILITADSINSETTWMDIDASMKLSDRGKMESELLIDLSNPKEMVLDFTMSSVMLEDFDVYCREGTGYPLLYGDLYLKSHTDVINDSIKSQNNIVIHNIKFGRREQPIGPPVKFAMFLLKDKDKVVHIDMPIEGPVGDSGTDIGKMVWDTFSKLLVKVVSTPFKFIGSVLNIFDTDIKRINYDYMDSTFTEQKERQLNTLLKVEDLDEELKVDLIYYKDSLLERQQIAMYLIGQEFVGGKSKKDFKKHEKRFRKYVEKRINSDSISLEEACLKLADKSQVDAISAAYDSARFRSLRRYLFSQRDTTEITLYHSRASAPNNEERKPRFEVKLGMKDDFIEEKYINKGKDK
ncbi:DUF748 domain-containing protein [Marinigracilibium pacificum]|uniref:DUF748 domain-containing protein n=1 Tax=Marinigracilibium pacificum TaxID=2729599 RepID=A0A848ITP3_9BACT|nr:DUF748 domain-containing protein [Marinigracilibium pacificum]NMM47717.1 DUF748 domain-containing protein [Marinigracilibium pacificum]